MPYIDYTYYTNEYVGLQVDEETFNKLVKRASNQIDKYTHFRLLSTPLEKYPTMVQNQVKMAVAAQVEYLHLQGGETSVHTQSVASGSIGNFSYTEKDSSGNGTVSSYAAEYLIPTGLLYAGVDSC